jgi:hypothetical protein
MKRVYLDQNHWSYLSLALGGQPRTQEEAEAAKAIVRSVADQEASFSLSIAHVVANDLNDLVYLSAAIGYCDMVVTERKWSAILSSTDVPARTGTVVLAKLAELPAPPPGPGRSGYVLTLPSGLIAQENGFVVCPNSKLRIGTRFACPQHSVVATGSLRMSAGSTSCHVDLELVADDNELGMQLEPLQPVAPCPSTSQRTSVRIATTSTAAGAPATLRFELPADVTGGSLSFRAGAASFLASVDCPTVDSQPQWRATLQNGSDTARAAERCRQGHAPTPPASLRAPTTELGPTALFKGIVVQQVPDAASFVLDDRHRIVLVHSPGTLPGVGTEDTVHARLISNGTLAEGCLTTRSRTGTKVTMQGVVSYVNASQHAFVLSRDGASLAITDTSEPPPVDHVATVTATLGKTSLTATNVTPGGPFTGNLVVTGVLQKAGANQGTAGDTIQLTPDDTGQLSDDFTDLVITGSTLSQLSDLTGISLEKDAVDVQVSERMTNGTPHEVLSKPKWTGEVTVKRLAPLDASSDALWQWFDHLKQTVLQCSSS